MPASLAPLRAAMTCRLPPRTVYVGDVPVLINRRDAAGNAGENALVKRGQCLDVQLAGGELFSRASQLIGDVAGDGRKEEKCAEIHAHMPEQTAGVLVRRAQERGWRRDPMLVQTNLHHGERMLESAAATIAPR